MTRYIGIDAHLESCTMTIMGPSGRRIREERLDTHAKVLAQALKRIPKPRRVCVEEGLQSEWLYEVLSPLCEEFIVAQVEGRRGNKNDSLDAWALADGLRRGTLSRTVYKEPGRFTALRAAVRSYSRLIQDIARTKIRLKALYGSRGHRCVGQKLYHPRNRDEFQKHLSPPYRKSAQLLFDELDHLTEVYNEARNWLVAEARNTPDVVRLTTMPCISHVRGAQIVSIVISPYRFRTRKQFYSYCGLGIVTRSSSDWTRQRDGSWARKEVVHTRGLNRNFNPTLKNVFKGTAQTIISHKKGSFYDGYLKSLDSGTKPNLATLTLARRVAATVLTMWKQGTDYNPELTARKESYQTSIV